MIDPLAAVFNNIRRIHPSLEDFHDCGDTGRLYIDSVDVTYDSTTPVETPVTIASSVYKNDTSVENTQHFVVQKERKNSFTFTLNEGIKAGAEFKAKLPFAGESDVDVELDISSSQEWTVETTRTWQYSADIPIPPHTMIEVVFAVLEGRLSTKYTLAANLRGGFSFREGDQTYVTDVERCLKTGYLNLGDARIFQAVDIGTFDGVDATKYSVTVTELSAGAKRTIDYGRIDRLNGKLVSDAPALAYAMV